MRLLRIALFVSAAFVPSVASASLITYDFTGVNGLAGTFSLDDAVPFTIKSSDSNGQSAVLLSPTNTIIGSFGKYTYSGYVSLHVWDSFRPDKGQEYWIVRGASNGTDRGVLSGPAVDGRSVVGLNLFNYQSSNGLMDLTVAAPTPRYNDPQGFFYTVAFSDGTFTQGQMLTLDKRPDNPTAVPEPASVVLLAIGGLFALGAYRQRCASLVPGVCSARMP